MGRKFASKIAVLLAAFLAVFCLSNEVFAEQSSFSAHGVTWVYSVDKSKTEPIITIGFKSVSSDATTVEIPTLAEVIAAINDPDLGEVDTYFIDNILDGEESFTVPENLSSVNMTNAADVQVRNLAPLFNNVGDNEIELIFGNGVIITDDYGMQKSGSSNASASNPGAFEGMHLKLTNLNRVKYIGWRAFENTTLHDTEVVITEEQTVGGRVFRGSNVTSLHLNTEEVGDSFCKSCANLTSLTFGTNVQKVYGEAFRLTGNLKQSIDTKNIKNIGALAFADSGITGVSFGGSIENIQMAAFMNTNLGSLDFTGISPRINAAAFNNAKLSSVNLGGLKYLDTLSFSENQITNLYLPKNLEYMGLGVFAGNPVNEVTVAFDTLAISSPVFRDAIGGTCGEGLGGGYYTDGQNVVSLAARNFDVNTNSSVRKLTVLAPYSSDEELPEGRREPSDYYAGEYVTDFAKMKNVVRGGYFEDFAPYLKELTIGDGIEFIESQSFAGICSGKNVNCGYSSYNKSGTQYEADANGDPVTGSITTFNLPSSLKGVGQNAFVGMLNSKDLTIESLPQNIEFIGNAAFGHMPNVHIKNFDHPNLKFIDGLAFLTARIDNIVIRDKIKYIGHGAFAGNRSLKTLTIDTDIFKKNDYGQYAILGGSGFNDVFTGSNSWSAYTYWTPLAKGYKNKTSDYAYEYHIEKITFTDKSIASHADGTDMQRLYVDEFDASQAKWTSIGFQTFYRAKIKRLSLPSTLKEIHAEGFYGAEIEQPITLPEGLEAIGTRAFWGTTGSQDDDILAGDYDNREPAPMAVDVTKIKVPIEALPSTIKTIGDFAFFKNKGITADVILPDLTEIGTEAFYGTNVRDVLLGNKIARLGKNVFYDTPELRNVTIDTNLYDLATNDEANSYASYSSFFGNFGNKENEFGTITFGANAGEPNFTYEEDEIEYNCEGFLTCDKKWAYFYGIKADEVDLSATNWKSLSPSMFQESEIDNVVLPNGLETIGEDSFYEVDLGDVTITSLKTVGREGFQWAKATINTLPEGLENIEESAFYGTDITDNLVIPSTVTHIGVDAFNGGDEDPYYETITIKPNLTLQNTDQQNIFQIFWGSLLDKLIVESETLPAMGTEEYSPEFYGMKMTEAEIKNLATITNNAFEDCVKLESVDLSADGALRKIGDEAFLNANKLNNIDFADSLKKETVNIGKSAFEGTAFETMGDSTTDFDLTAAKFRGLDGYAFYGMPKLRTVDVPASFSNATIPTATFANDAELTEATISYKTTLIDNAAFANDDKLARIFIWGNTIVRDNKLPGYVAPEFGHGGLVGTTRNTTELGLTIPETTDIYAYSAYDTEEYAGHESREDFEGTFYPLDEVLYITSNKPTVLINDEADDFDKSDLVVYALRRDGLVLESDEWGEYDGAVYPRSTSNLNFEKMAQTIADDEAFGTVWDTPVPLDEMTVGNINFEDIDFELVSDGDTAADVRLVNIIYTDGYTRGTPDTDVDPYAPNEDNPIVPDPVEEIIEDLIDGPVTLAQSIIGYIVIALMLTGATIFAVKQVKN